MTTQSGRRVLVMAGGTGGHVIPALSLARALAERGVEVEWLGSPRGIENQLVPQAGFALHRIAVNGLRGNGVTGWLVAPWRLGRAVWEAYRVVRDFDPQLVVGLGGFASGPGGLAAWLTRRPLVIHEQNAVAGLTNRVLARLARRTFAAFPQAFAGRAEVVGNPVRAEIAALGEQPRAAGSMRQRSLRLLVVGGSLGALALNQRMPEALARLAPDQRPEVYHQAGRDKDEATRASYVEQGVEARVSAFIDDMAAAYDWADLVVCRAGALTVAELAAAAKPALFVPFPHAVDDHQTANATALVEEGAASLMPQDEMSAAVLCERLATLLDPDSLAAMASRARRCARLDAMERLAAGCMETGFE
ncbi:undecaprenyldiphospho-muramoylpentapeptide beta-N-acetylglucosaminyltransferase [Halomonas halmophila]|uniref:UDP-N-acetylglucosamine--N-acetylmuramyl-(pentapeptide) pyrophosphoryl-undecaprenol N-acetylglucosamine transferase n=1 Tax=Halomonas halmophila TaxID=252 RepID=A0A4Y4EYH3_9GAMM|nr:undecaprenyldiphospho-muramoylpentapeptide beta-N-acetylglucosaminyltransferase [Halomonas halmophila]GED22196.1 UDP-N-acetylglucosamine--N-acetylmuramyl-(pentapeptide) pyrophosphoryl-undecaprenol N-acetylglucosamine transferase [Halomonas halmophila]